MFFNSRLKTPSQALACMLKGMTNSIKSANTFSHFIMEPRELGAYRLPIYTTSAHLIKQGAQLNENRPRLYLSIKDHSIEFTRTNIPLSEEDLANEVPQKINALLFRMIRFVNEPLKHKNELSTNEFAVLHEIARLSGVGRREDSKRFLMDLLTAHCIDENAYVNPDQDGDYFDDTDVSMHNGF